MIEGFFEFESFDSGIFFGRKLRLDLSRDILGIENNLEIPSFAWGAVAPFPVRVVQFLIFFFFVYHLIRLVNF